MLHLICRLFGHQWSNPSNIDGREPYVYRTECGRCHDVVFGNWDRMEAIGAWKHYRGFGS